MSLPPLRIQPVRSCHCPEIWGAAPEIWGAALAESGREALLDCYFSPNVAQKTSIDRVFSELL